MTYNIEIEKRDYLIPETYLPKSFRMKIKPPIHNYKASRSGRERWDSPPFVELSENDLYDMFKQIAMLLGYDLQTLNYTKNMLEEYHKITKQILDIQIKQTQRRVKQEQEEEDNG